MLPFIARKRLAAGRLTVVDATNVQPESRKPLIAIAREFHCLPVAIFLDVPERVAHDRQTSVKPGLGRKNNRKFKSFILAPALALVPALSVILSKIKIKTTSKRGYWFRSSIPKI